MKRLFGLVAVFALASSHHSSAQVYSSESSFLSAISGLQYNVNDFNNVIAALPGGNASLPPQTYITPIGVSYVVSSSLPSGDVWGLVDTSTYGGALSTVNARDSLKLQVTAGAVRAIGGNFFLTDELGGISQGGLTLLLSDGTTVGIPVDVAGPFVGYVAPGSSYINGFVLSSGSPDAYASLDHIYVAVPEPGVLVTNALILMGAVGGGWYYRRRKA